MESDNKKQKSGEYNDNLETVWGYKHIYLFYFYLKRFNIHN
jgi:hypothetical protein